MPWETIMQPYRQPTDAELQALLDQAIPVRRPMLENDVWYEDGRCVAFQGEHRCPLPEDWKVFMGCEHEHVSRSGLCDDHTVMVEHMRAPVWFCRLCKNKGYDVRVSFIRKEPAHDEPEDEDVMIG